MDPSPDIPPERNPAAETMTAPIRERPRPDREILSPPPVTMLLEVVGGPMDGIKAHGAGDVITVGRSVSNDLSLRLDPMVSTAHARIVRDGSSFWLEDLDSRNGTYIGDQRIQGRMLIGPGTLFVLGNTCLEFLAG